MRQKSYAGRPIGQEDFSVETDRKGASSLHPLSALIAPLR
jgi:hypothetical protein